MLHELLLTALRIDDGLELIHSDRLLSLSLFLLLVQNVSYRITEVWLTACLLDAVFQVVTLYVFIYGVERLELSLQCLIILVLVIRVLHRKLG